MIATKPTVAQVLHTLRVGGAEVLAARLARRMGDAFRFVFICLDELGELGAELQAEGFPVHVLDRRAGLDWRCSRRLAVVCRREHIDVVHAHQYTPFFYGAVGRWVGRRQCPILFTEHGRHFPDLPRRRRIVANRFLLGRRDRVVGVGQAVRRALIDNEGIAAGRVGVINNGVPLERFEAPPGTGEAVRAELGLDRDAFVAVLVGRLDYLKDHATAVRSWHEVVRERPDASLLLVGEGPERPGIEARVESLGLGNRVLLLGLRTDVPRLLAAADVGLLTSISEGIPLTLIEAMAAGLPVVSTDVGGVREIVVEDETGLLAPAGDHEGLAKHLIALAGDPGRRAALGRQGKERAHAVFSERTMHDHYRQIYDDLLRSR